MTMMHPGWMAWGGGGAWTWLLTLTLVVVAAILVTRLLLPRPSDRSPDDAALDVLRTRFASGEIDEAEYLHRRATLSRPDRGAQP
jgi:putative membrane protein